MLKLADTITMPIDGRQNNQETAKLKLNQSSSADIRL